MISKKKAPGQWTPPPRVQIQNRQRRYKIDRTSAAAFCFQVLKAVGRQESGLSAVFIGIREMIEMNARYRQKKYPTDVLSFNYGDIMMDSAPFLGEILIAPEIAYKNARTYRIHPDKEIKKLLIHGVLHLSGYDHETDRGEMQQMQTKLMRRSFVQKAATITEDLKADE